MQNKNLIYIGLFLQVVILAGVFAKAFYPLIWGQEVEFRVNSIDPRDIFRGNYSTLNYSFSQIQLDSIPNDLGKCENYYFGDKIYVELEKKGDFHEPVGVWKNPPKDKLFITAIFSSYYPNVLNVKAGIETFFATPEKATEIDGITRGDSLNHAAKVQVMVAKDGHARIKDLSYYKLDN